MKDPGSFIIGITIGGSNHERAMLDSGASINLMPFSVYKKLGLNDLRKTTMSLVLADASARSPKGIVEDVLIQVEKLIIPADFVVIEMDEGRDEGDVKLLLSRPFMATTRVVIDMHAGKLTMKVLDETVEFDIFNSLNYPIGSHDCGSVDFYEEEVNIVV